MNIITVCVEEKWDQNARLTSCHGYNLNLFNDKTLFISLLSKDMYSFIHHIATVNGNDCKEVTLIIL